jgi:cytochrome c oxidase subunit 2
MRTRLKAAAGGLISLAMAGQGFAAEKGGIASPTDVWNKTWDEVLVDLFVIGIVFGLASIYMLIRFRARSPEDVGKGKRLPLDKALAWAIVPAAIFLADDFLLSAKGWSLWNVQRIVPNNAMEIKVTGHQWYFDYEYANGVKSDDLIVPVGKPIVLRMTSDDVIHSFGLIDYRLKEDMMPGRITYLWFYPDKPLSTKVVCVEFCGTSHSEMNSDVKAIPQADFDKWLAAKKAKAELEGAQSARN